MSSTVTDALLNKLVHVNGVKETLKTGREESNLAALIAGISTVAFAILGIATMGTGACIIPLGIAALSLYALFNFSHTKTNIDAIIDSPSRYFKLDAEAKLCYKIDSDALKTELKKNTFLFDWAIDGYVDSLIASLNPNIVQDQNA